MALKLRLRVLKLEELVVGKRYIEIKEITYMDGFGGRSYPAVLEWYPFNQSDQWYPVTILDSHQEAGDVANWNPWDEKSTESATAPSERTD